MKSPIAPGSISLLPSLVQAEVDDALVARIREAMSQPDFQPGTLPRVAVRMLALARNPRAGVEDVQRLIEDDPRLVARVMRVASSVLYAAGRATSLRAALVRLGFRGVRDIVIEATVDMVMMRPGRFSAEMEAIWRHCRVTAHLARLVGRYIPGIDWEEAFLCALLHDVGLATSLTFIANEAANTDDAVAFACARRVHEEAGAAVARIWELPEEVRLVLGCHHTLLHEGVPQRMAAVVSVANHLAQEASPIPESLDGDDPDEFPHALDLLELSPEALRIVRDRSGDALSLLDG